MDPILTATNYLPKLGSVNPANSIPDDYPTFLVSVNNPKSYAVISLVTVDLWWLVVVILASQVLFVLGALLRVVLTPRGMEGSTDCWRYKKAVTRIELSPTIPVYFS